MIPSAHKPHLAPWADIKVCDAGPGEWLYLIAHARFVYTDSFHGALFSIKFKKPFLAYYKEKIRAPRLLDLAKRYAVERSVVGSLDEALENQFWKPLDYQKTEALMVEDANQSRAFLDRALTNL